MDIDSPVVKAYQVELKGRYIDGSPFCWRSQAVFVDHNEAEEWKDKVIEAQCKPPKNDLDPMVDRETVTSNLIPLDVFL